MGPLSGTERIGGPAAVAGTAPSADRKYRSADVTPLHANSQLAAMRVGAGASQCRAVPGRGTFANRNAIIAVVATA